MQYSKSPVLFCSECREKVRQPVIILDFAGASYRRSVSVTLLKVLLHTELAVSAAILSRFANVTKKNYMGKYF